VRRRGLLFQHFLRPGLERRKPAIEHAQPPSVEPEGPPGEAAEKGAVVTDEKQAGVAFGQLPLQPLDRRQIEMVRRLVEQQNVRRSDQGTGQIGAARLAAGEAGGWPGGVERHAVEQCGDAVVRRVGKIGETRGDMRAHRGLRGGLRLLRKIGDPGSRLEEPCAAVKLDLAGQCLQQR
jgi:hypothetical protein